MDQVFDETQRRAGRLVFGKLSGDEGRAPASAPRPFGADGGSVATYQDITDSERDKEDLQKYADKLEQSNSALQDFAYVSSHDLQEPLRKIEAFSDRLLAKCSDQLSDDGKLYIDRMQNASQRMRLLITDLLSYSRITTNAKPFTPIDLTKIAAEVVSDLQIRLEETEGTVNIEPLPTIYADRTQMRQLLQNLIANALKFHRPGTPPIVTVKARVFTEEEESAGVATQARETCELTISDNGIGFDEKYLDRIFNIFQRLHGKSEYEGTGIGLATCRKIVERHVGSVTASSIAGEGATFTVTLPVKQAAIEDE